MSFTDDLWRSIDPIYHAILDHPFVAELTAGTLSRDRFVFYMQQDSLYLQDFSRALALAGARSPTTETMDSFLHFAASAISVERALHESYFTEFEVEPAESKAPACFAYTNYLLATTALRSHPEGVAALLPCFWIYREVGNNIVDMAHESLATNPYRRWIETYSGEVYNEAVERAIAITNEVARDVTQELRARMQRAFATSARLEWMFWDSAYRLEPWQPS